VLQFQIDEYTLALLCLVTHGRQEGFGARAWKGVDWETMNRLHEKEYTSNPISKAKSVSMSEEGFLKAKEFFERYFTTYTPASPLTRIRPDIATR